MLTVDKLLLKIASHSSPAVEDYMSAKDARLARSLATALNNHNFFTENQAKLLVKLLTPHVAQLNTIDSHSEQILNQLSWSKSFRIVDQVRKVYLYTSANNELGIFIEFSFSSQVRKVLNTVSSNLQSGLRILSTKTARAELT